MRVEKPCILKGYGDQSWTFSFGADLTALLVFKAGSKQKPLP